jgi:hypothetical protein
MDPRAERPLAVLVIVLVSAIVGGVSAAGLQLTIDAPASLAGAAARIRTIDLRPLERELAAAGFDTPPLAHITLVPNDAARARETPAWVAGQAFGRREIVIFPERISSYPYDSLESVVRHEIVHLTIEWRAGGRGLPRWFHEGVAESVGNRRGLAGGLRLLVAAAGRPAIRDVTALFRSDSEPEAALGYLLAAALVDDIRLRHGAGVPGAIATRVGGGVPFARAFAMETGESVEEAAARAWAFYSAVPQWLAWATSPQTLWSAILVLACLAAGVRWRQRARRRRLWDEEDRFLE